MKITERVIKAVVFISGTRALNWTCRKVKSAESMNSEEVVWEGRMFDASRVLNKYSRSRTGENQRIGDCNQEFWLTFMAMTRHDYWAGGWGGWVKGHWRSGCQETRKFEGSTRGSTSHPSQTIESHFIELCFSLLPVCKFIKILPPLSCFWSIFSMSTPGPSFSLRWSNLRPGLLSSSFPLICINHPGTRVMTLLTLMSMTQQTKPKRGIYPRTCRSWPFLPLLSTW